jgi:hypothetical protein
MERIFGNPLHGSTLFFKISFPETHKFQTPLHIINASSNNRQVLAELKKGHKFCFQGTWGTAMAFYSWLKKQVQNRYPVNDYASSRIQREKLNTLTENLFLPIKNHQPDLAKAPGNTWLKEFYSEEKEFHLRFTDYLGMNGARQWYEKGIQFPGLNHKLHPFYGTYFPTRTEHLELFDNWLAGQKGLKSAVDMGTGCGVLTFYLLKHGIKNITATDINPNALFSIKQDLTNTEMLKQVNLIQTSFFDGLEMIKPDVVVFNPPWIPAETHTSIDQAMYYQPGFFDEFFGQAYGRLPDSCKLVILFSNFAQVVNTTSENPIESELKNHQRFLLEEKITQKLQQKTSPRKDWLSQIRSREEAELWVLTKKS